MKKLEVEVSQQQISRLVAAFVLSKVDLGEPFSMDDAVVDWRPFFDFTPGGDSCRKVIVSITVGDPL